MKKSLIAIVLLSAALSIASAGNASIAPPPELSKPTSATEQPVTQKYKMGLHCFSNDQCRLRTKAYLSAESATSRLWASGGGSTCEKVRHAIVPVIGPQTGGYVSGAYLEDAGVLPQGNSCIAT